MTIYHRKSFQLNNFGTSEFIYLTNLYILKKHHIPTRQIYNTKFLRITKLVIPFKLDPYGHFCVRR